MTRWINTILLLLGTLTSAYPCSYYPFGEDIRFRMLNTSAFGYSEYAVFDYTSHWFEPQLGSEEAGRWKNVELWRKWSGADCSKEDIYDALYGSHQPGDRWEASNTFMKYLKKNREGEEYLKFAWKCSDYNVFLTDPWERRSAVQVPGRKEMMLEAVKRASSAKDSMLGKRYAFLAVRLALYGSDTKFLRETYDNFFEGRKDKDLIDYWAMYFRMSIEPEGPEKLLMGAQVFKHAPDKRFVVYQRLGWRLISEARSVPKSATMDQKTAVHLIKAVTYPGKALESIERLYNMNPSEEALGFVLLRELAKLEDWIYTPHYTRFAPTVHTDRTSEQYASYARMQAQIAKDRTYARKLLRFVESVDLSKVHDPAVWQAMVVYLNFMTGQNEQAIVKADQLLKLNDVAQSVKDQINQFRVLAMLGRQPAGQCIVPEEVRSFVIKQHQRENYRFIFAMARELRYKSNTTDGAALLSTLLLRRGEKYSYYALPWESPVMWKGRKDHLVHWYMDYYNDYTDYLDGQYTTDQLQELVNRAVQINKADSFEMWQFRKIRADLPRLYDLLGTKFVRKDQLSKALYYFKRVPDTLWTSKHYPFYTYLNANPFYANFYSAHSKTGADTIRYNKETLVRKLILHLEKARNPKAKGRDLHYFLAANCYLNMTQYGNSWMMRRYYWSSSPGGVKGYLDDAEYYGCRLACKYYLKAREHASTQPFKALSLRMAGRCEKHRLAYQMEDEDIAYGSWEKYRDELFRRNKYYRQLKKEYPDDYDDLISNCYSFEDYFAKR